MKNRLAPSRRSLWSAATALTAAAAVASAIFGVLIAS